MSAINGVRIIGPQKTKPITDEVTTDWNGGEKNILTKMERDTSLTDAEIRFLVNVLSLDLVKYRENSMIANIRNCDSTIF
jgi:hypothetical protein